MINYNIYSYKNNIWTLKTCRDSPYKEYSQDYILVSNYFIKNDVTSTHTYVTVGIFIYSLSSYFQRLNTGVSLFESIGIWMFLYNSNLSAPMLQFLHTNTLMKC